MNRLVLLVALLLLAAPVFGQAHFHNGKRLCGDTASSSTPLQLFDTATGRWCPGATVNDAGNDVDVCIEGDTDANLFCTDAGNERVCVSCSDPQSQLDVRGDAGAAGTATLSTAELTVVDGDSLGCLNFQAPMESSGTDSILVSAAICAESSTTFSATANTTDLVFKNGVSEAAAETVRILANGVMVPISVTADPCVGTVDIGGIFYNSTSGYHCFCNGAGADIKMNDNTTACF